MICQKLIIKGLVGKKNNIHNTTIIDNGTMKITDIDEVSNSFNDYFVSVGKKLSVKISPDTNLLSYVSSNLHSIANPHLDDSDVRAISSSLNNSSVGHDNLPAYLPTYLLPDQLKIAKVFFSKLFEMAVYTHVNNFIDKNDLLYKQQFGFRKEHSTQHALMTFTNKISKSLDEGEIMIGVFLDLKKAFDCVDHTIYTSE